MRFLDPMKLSLLALCAAMALGAAPPTNSYFHGVQPPKCFMHNGKTIIHYDERHTSFKCSHNAARTSCHCEFAPA